MSDPEERASAASSDPAAEQGEEQGARAGGSARPPQESLGEALSGLVGVLFRRGRVGVERAAVQTRFRLDLRQLKRDRDLMYQKLGRELRTLIAAGEITHPGLVRGVERIGELDRKIAEVEADLGVVGAPDDEDPPAPEGSR